MTKPHHAPDGTFRNPWPHQQLQGWTGLFKWALTRRAVRDPARPGDFPIVAPDFAFPRADVHRVSLTWVGHATFLMQIGGLNVLTDPVWSERASPVSFAGPARYTPPAVPFAALPPIDAVLVSHNHYDHLDDATVRQLVGRYPSLRWFVPLGLAAWLEERGARGVSALDWWDREDAGAVSVQAVPAQHFSARGPVRNRSLWCGWVVGAEGRSVYFAGDTGFHAAFAEIGERAGPFDAVLMPIGAYEPRWFMRPVHVNPEEAVTAYRHLVGAQDGRRATMVGMHWGTFKLTDEPMHEPPGRTRAAWADAGLPASDLWIPRHGETHWL